MACTSLVSLPRACGAEGVVAGLEKLYAIAYSDLAIVTGTTNHTVSSSGIVNQIGLDSTKKFVEVGLLKSTAGLQEALTKNAQTGTAFLTQTLTLVIGNLTAENKTFAESVLNQPVAIMLKTRTGKYFVAGLNGQFELSGLEGGTGVAEGDLIGYTLTFTGISTSLIPQVDETIISTLIA